MDIASIVRYHRKKADLTQQELARLAGVGKTVVFDIEKGKDSVRLSTLLKVLHVISVRLSWDSPLKSAYLKEHNDNDMEESDAPS